jgi:uncharacterized protein (DUF1015 family)
MKEGNKMQTIKAAHILLPKETIDMYKWAVIACDQYTCQPMYWQDLKKYVGGEPSTLNCIFPEVYLSKDNSPMIQKINQAMEFYIEQEFLVDMGPSMMLVDRTTTGGKHRLGLVLAIDLEDYNYEPGSKSLIRATEDTILDRLPPRVQIREKASIEFPHTLLLVNDPEVHIIETLFQNRHLYKKCYDFDLNMDGGHVAGYQITECDGVINQFYSLIEGQTDPLLFVVGDGNHSLATAKAHWESVKKQIPLHQRGEHTARYALVEVINLYDPGMSFEAIHRVVFHAEPGFVDALKNAVGGESSTWMFSNELGKINLDLPISAPKAYKVIQAYVEQLATLHPQVEIDYIHGENHLMEVCRERIGSVGICMPTLSKSDLFETIKQGQVLPKKSFSMGHASDKRYYLESKKIIGFL